MKRRTILREPAYRWFCVAVFAVAAWVTWTGWNLARHYANLRADGVTARGVVVAAQTRPGLRGGTVRTIRYAFVDANGVTHEAASSLRDAREGETIDVTYLPGDPERHVPFVVTADAVRQPLRDALRFALTLLGATALLGAVVELLPRLARRRRGLPSTTR